MKLVRCIKERMHYPDVTEVGKEYWVDEEGIFEDLDGDKYAPIYADKEKLHLIGNKLLSRFEIVGEEK